MIAGSVLAAEVLLKLARVVEAAHNCQGFVRGRGTPALEAMADRLTRLPEVHRRSAAAQRPREIVDSASSSCGRSAQSSAACGTASAPGWKAC
jgi:hypothetical protein